MDRTAKTIMDQLVLKATKKIRQWMLNSVLMAPQSLLRVRSSARNLSGLVKLTHPSQFRITLTPSASSVRRLQHKRLPLLS